MIASSLAYLALLMLSHLFTPTDALTAGESSGSCDAQFLAQPPVGLPCNPYNPLDPDLRLECTVASVNTNLSFRIRWYRQVGNITESIFRRDSPGPIVITALYTLDNNTALTRSRLFMTNITEQDVGQYWCQVELEEPSERVIRPCTTTTLAPPSFYTGLLACSQSYLFSLGPVCAYPQVECPDVSSSSSSFNAVTPTPTITHSCESPSAMPSVSTPLGQLSLLSLVIISLLVITSIGLLSLTVVLCCLTVRRRRSKPNSYAATDNIVYSQDTQVSDTPLAESPVIEIVNRTKHCPMIPTRKLHMDAVRQEPDSNGYHSMGSKAEAHPSTWQSPSTTREFHDNNDPVYADVCAMGSHEQRETLPSVDCDGSTYHILRSPARQDSVQYTVPSKVTRRDTRSSTSSDPERQFDISDDDDYENEPAPMYTPLNAGTVDKPRTYSEVNVTKCHTHNTTMYKLPIATSTVSISSVTPY